MKAQTLMILAGLSCGHIVFAQNILRNPHFDASTDSWEVDAGGSWTNAKDHTGDGADAGSLLIEAQAKPQAASQCVDIAAGNVYLMSAWVMQPSFSFDPCPASFAVGHLQVQWLDDVSCSGNTVDIWKPTNFSFPSDTWVQQTLSGIPPDGARSAEIQVLASCQSNQVASYYFDDVSFEFDRIFSDSFDLVLE